MSTYPSGFRQIFHIQLDLLLLLLEDPGTLEERVKIVNTRGGRRGTIEERVAKDWAESNQTLFARRTKLDLL